MEVSCELFRENKVSFFRGENQDAHDAVKLIVLEALFQQAPDALLSRYL